MDVLYEDGTSESRSTREKDLTRLKGIQEGQRRVELEGLFLMELFGRTFFTVDGGLMN